MSGIQYVTDAKGRKVARVVKYSLEIKRSAQ
jgi:hypothetical protein